MYFKREIVPKGFSLSGRDGDSLSKWTDLWFRAGPLGNILVYFSLVFFSLAQSFPGPIIVSIQRAHSGMRYTVPVSS